MRDNLSEDAVFSEESQARASNPEGGSNEFNVYIPGDSEYTRGKFPALDKQLDDMSRKQLVRRPLSEEEEVEISRLRGAGIRFRQERQGESCVAISIDVGLLRQAESDFIDELDRLVGMTERLNARRSADQ